MSCHILDIVLRRMREMQVNVIQTLHYYGSNVEVNKQHVSVVKRCRNVMVPISCTSVMLQMVLGYLFLPVIILGTFGKFVLLWVLLYNCY